MSYINPLVYKAGVDTTLTSSTPNYLVVIGSNAVTSATTTLSDLGAAAIGYPDASGKIELTGNTINIPNIPYGNTQALNTILGNSSITATYFSVIQSAETAIGSTTKIDGSTTTTAWAEKVAALTSTSSSYTTSYKLMIQGTLSNPQSIYSGNQFKLNATNITITSTDVAS